jgi:hypothetical protein
MPNLAETLTRSGIPYPQATEIARQMTAGAGNGSVDKLLAVGVPMQQSIALAAQINAATFTAHTLATSGWNHSVARILKSESGF